MNGLKETQKTVTAILEAMARRYDTRVIDNALTFGTKVGDTHVSVTFIFRYNPSNKKLWAVQTIDTLRDNNMSGRNEFLAHLESDASAEDVLDLLYDFLDTARDTVNSYKDAVSHAEYKQGI